MHKNNSRGPMQAENWGGRTGGRSGREGREAPASLPKEASLRVLSTMRPARLLCVMRRAIASLRALFTMRPARLLCVMLCAGGAGHGPGLCMCVSASVCVRTVPAREQGVCARAREFACVRARVCLGARARAYARVCWRTLARVGCGDAEGWSGKGGARVLVYVFVHAVACIISNTVFLYIYIYIYI